MKLDPALRERMAARKLAHAYLITGQERAALAEAMAAALVCTGPRPPCGACAACRKAAQRIHPDIARLGDEGSGLKAEQVRALRADAYIRPNEAAHKIYILTHSEELNQTGQNILLKLLEEGPAYAAFLLLSPNPEFLLPTIRSRCELLRARGEEEIEATEDGASLAELLLSGASLEQSLPLLVSLEKRERRQIAHLLDETVARLTAVVSERSEFLALLDRLAPIRAACEFNIGAGHLAGWIAAVLS